jgi:glycosyltransferase involved in cell wall biosynthesis
MSREPCVSVIVIAFNGEAFLAEAIESVLAQDFDDYELLIVDDGSTDGTRRIAEGYRGAHPAMVRVLQHDDGANHGMSAARNLGLAQARGEFIAFLDADDVWAPGKLADQVAILRARPEVGLVYGRARIWRSWAGGGEDFFYDLGVAPDQVHPPPSLFHRQLRNLDQAPTSSGSMMRADAVRAAGGFEPRFRSMFEDQVFFAKLLLRTPAYVSGATWFDYRQHAGSATACSAARGGDERARLVYLRWLEAYLRPLRGFEAELAAVRETARALRGPTLPARIARRARRLASSWPRSWSRSR